MKKIIENTYLMRLYKADRALFAALGMYVLVLLGAAALRHEEFLFFLFGMYSQKEYPQQEYITYSIEVDGKEINYQDYPDAKRELITVPLAHAVAAQENFEMDVNGFVKLQAWLYDYLGLRDKGGKMVINKLRCAYSKEGKPIVITKEPIAIYGSK